MLKVNDQNLISVSAFYEKLNQTIKQKIYITNFILKKSIYILEGTAHYAGLLLASAEGFGLRLILVLPSAKALSLSFYHESKSTP